MPKNDNKVICPTSPSISFPFHIDIDKAHRGLSLSCSGVKGISELSDVGILIKLSFAELKIVGKGLSISVFEDKCVEIIGKISEVCFIYGKA